MLIVIIESLIAILDTTTGAVVVTDADGVVALGEFSLEKWWLEDELGPLSDDGSDESLFVQIQDAFTAELEEREPEPGDHYDDGADDAYALASAFGYDPEYC